MAMVIRGFHRVSTSQQALGLMSEGKGKGKREGGREEKEESTDNKIAYIIHKIVK